MLQIPDWMDFQADIRPDDIALITPRIAVSHRQIRDASIAAAAELEKQGVGRGRLVAVQAVNPALQFVLLLALHRLGATVCLLPQEPVRRKAGLESVKFDWFLTDRDEKLSGAKLLPVSLEWLAGLKPVRKSRQVGFEKPDEISLICMSSGTTSAPKPMPFSVEVMTKRVVWRALGEQGFRHGEKVLLQAGLGAMNGLLSLLSGLWCGATVYMGFNPKNAMEAIARDHIERLFTSSTLLFESAPLVEAKTLDLSSLRQIHCGGDFISPNLVARVAKTMCANLCTDFGTNEVGRIAFNPIKADGFCAEDAGALCPWAEAQAVDENDAVLPRGQEGHLRFRSPLMIGGYFENSQASAQRFRGGWFYSDDIGWVTTKDRLVISGRARDFIHAGNGRFNPVQIDHAFDGHPKIVEAAGFGVKTNQGDEIWLALVARAPITDKELMDFGLEKLGPRAPRHFLRLDQLPRTETGKLSRRHLAQAVAKSSA